MDKVAVAPEVTSGRVRRSRAAPVGTFLGSPRAAQAAMNETRDTTIFVGLGRRLKIPPWRIIYYIARYHLVRMRHRSDPVELVGCSREKSERI